MSQGKWILSRLQKGFLLRMTILNVIIITIFVGVSGWSIYNTACFLVANMDTGGVRQSQFRQTLFHYLLIFSLCAITLGSILNYVFTRKLLQPIRDLIETTKALKEGKYPKPVSYGNRHELDEFIGHYNELVNQLEENERERKKIVTDLSHELRTPLSNISGYLNALKSGVLEGNQELYESLYEESNRLTNMVQQLDQLKEWDHVSHQRLAKAERVNIETVIRSCISIFQRTMEQRGVECAVEVEAQELYIDQEGIQQVLNNLLDNALRYYAGGAPLLVKGKLKQDTYQVSIKGPGTGIAEEDREKIFERFYRADPSRSRETGGTGLGLAIAREIVERHGGQIGVESEGSEHTFWFDLPIKGALE
ncbi:HAMP domain-containing sensor histidine kinase [Pontibacillus salipaludis]|uniref:sensor histidine kinase n=1 Tax=Pontibacillus salipaludis TaxID=1697394 RepID=UPI0031EA951B